ncbi:MAG TPA: hypothetical protein VNH41_05010 [Steroidobacteraceae bacterium]|nr:hypothetical protein [Steroidobacteraceae bacterium]
MAVISASFVRRLISEAHHTQVSAAHAIGISPRAMRRYVSEGTDYRQPPMVVLVALRGLPKKRPKQLKAYGSKP